MFRLFEHRRGEAQSLGNIGLLHRRRGEDAVALKYLEQARTAYLGIGLRGAGVRVVERAIAEISAGKGIR